MDIDFKIELSEFYQGFSPLAHIDSLTFIGGRGQASEMRADVISKPGFITQSPDLANLTNGNESGVVTELIKFILEVPVDGTYTYALGTSKLFKLSSSTVINGGSPSWPQAVTGMAEGCSLVRLNDNLFGFFNTAGAGDILTMPLATGTIDPDWGSSTDTALEKAPHPSAVKEDIILFGNGQYLGSYIEGLATLDVQHLDFGEGAEVVDVIYHSGYWWIAVNYGERKSQIFLYDGSALSNILSDEVAVGTQRIGFLYAHNGVIWVTFTDSSSDGYAMGYLSGKVLKPLRYFSGSLPDYRQKSLYKNTIIFIAGSDVWSFGATVDQLPAQISKLASAGHSTVGALSSPFGTPIVASYDGDTGYRLAKFSGYSLNSSWKSRLIDLMDGKRMGKIQSLVIHTKALGDNAKAIVTLEGNQGDLVSNELVIDSSEGLTRHVFNNISLSQIEDVRVSIDFSEGNATNDCPIRKIVILGNYVER